MRHSEIKIRGDFWDTFIYMKYLVLITYENELIICNWKHIQNDFFRRTNLQYVFEINEEQLHKYIIYKKKIPLKSLLADFCIMDKKIYITNDEGFFSCNILLDIQDECDFVKLWDNRSFSLNSNRKGNIALSCGSDGLIEFSQRKDNLNIHLKEYEKNLYLVSSNHSTFSNYNEFDIYNISAIDEPELLHFNLGMHFDKRELKKYKLSEILNFSNSRSSHQYEQGMVSWLHKNNIYRIINSNQIEVISYDKNFFISKGIMSFQSWKGKILSGMSCSFGNIIECENALVVNFSSDSFLNIEGEVTKWRTYPNSRTFLNHLHVIHDDCLEIYQFYN